MYGERRRDHQHWNSTYYSIIFAHHSSVVFYTYLFPRNNNKIHESSYRRLYLRIIQQRCYQLKIKANKHLVVLLVRIFCSAETRHLKMSDADAIHQSVTTTQKVRNGRELMTNGFDDSSRASLVIVYISSREKTFSLLGISISERRGSMCCKIVYSL